jgi:predicted nucleic acid-binding protein
LRQNLLDPLAIEIVLCEEPVAVALAQMTEQIETRALNDFVDDGVDLTWQRRRDLIQCYSRDLRSQQANWRPRLRGEQDLPAPCGQRCRLGDYIIAATAHYHNALLLTTDNALLSGFRRHPDLFPPALSPDGMQ